MTDMDDLKSVVALGHPIENLKTISLHELCANTFDARALRRLGVSADEFNRRINRGKDIYRAQWARFAQVFMDRFEVSGCARAIADDHKTPQRFQKAFIASS